MDGYVLVKYFLMPRYCRLVVGTLAFLLSLSLVQAGEVAPNKGYAGREYTQQLLTALTSQGISKQWVLSQLAQAKRQPAILTAIARPAEKTKPWYEYRNIFLDASRIDNGVLFWQENHAVLAQVAQQMGIPAEIIIAIIGVETRYGRVAGRYRVLDALTTLCYDYPPRSDFFCSELVAYFLLTHEQQQDPQGLKGSYAGAMGFGQFMPSSYRNYAVDFDGDNKVDIWTNKADAIASVGNYLKRHGWQTDQPIIVPATFSAPPDLKSTLTLDENHLPRDERYLALSVNTLQIPTHTRAAIAELGLTIDGDDAPSTLWQVFAFQRVQSVEYWLAATNFYVISRYNHSRLYALAVFQLSQEIKRAYLAAGNRL